jgi:hypothetical protein
MIVGAERIGLPLRFEYIDPRGSNNDIITIGGRVGI